MLENYILDENKNPVLVDITTPEGWRAFSEFRSQERYWQVARTKIRGTQGCVSTVFLSLDHRFGNEPLPVLWETMVFDVPGFDGEQERYSSHADAVAGHKRWVKRVSVPFYRRWWNALFR
jgi:hypothetical protein